MFAAVFIVVCHFLVFPKEFQSQTPESNSASLCFELLDDMLERGVSEAVVPMVFATMYACMDRYTEFIWARNSSHCQQICLKVPGSLWLLALILLRRCMVATPTCL